MDETFKIDQCKLEVQETNKFAKSSRPSWSKLSHPVKQRGPSTMSDRAIPSREAVIEIVHQALRILFPGTSSVHAWTG